MISLKNLTTWANFEEAKTFFRSFPGNHKTFGPWKQSFLRKEKKIKNEAQQRLMKELGGSGKQYYTPPVEGISPQSCTETDFEMKTSNLVLFLLISVVSVHFRAIDDETIPCQA